MKFSLSLVLILLFSSCATTPLSEEEKKVRVLRNSDAPLKCQERGRVLAHNLVSFTEEGIEQYLKREAHKIGGNLVQIIRRDIFNGDIHAMAFSCKGLF